MICNNRWLRSLYALVLLGVSPFALAQSGAGTYKGTYSGSGDTGTVSIVVDQNGGVSCDFVSATTGTDYSGTGSVYTTAPFNITCQSAATASNFLAVTGTGTAGGTITGNFAAEAASAAASFPGTFTASYASPGSVNLAALTGLWFDPNYSGTGFNFIGAATGLAVTFYGVTSSGKQLWLTGNGPTSVVIGTSVSITMSSNSGGTFAQPIHDPQTWGTLQVTFGSCTTATAVLSGTDGTVTQSLVPLVVVQGAPGC